MKKLEINEYQKKAHTFADYPVPTINGTSMPWTYPVQGLGEECGEVQGKLAKALRDCNGKIDNERRKEIIKELGDVCWFVAELSTLMGVSLEEVMQGNIDKLESRKARNCIHGDGDNR